ncbi:MAG: SPOR domain-containing protein [Hyphomicrobium sp.]
MGQMYWGKSGRFVHAAAATAAFAIVVSASSAVMAEPANPPAKAPAKADAAEKPQANGKRAYEAAVKSYEAGKLQPAVDQFSEALRVGGLPSSDMARALYLRGLAYKKQNKPGLAISDLTSSLWLKNGLNEADRQLATAERAEAYRLAGLGSGTSVSESGIATEAQVSKGPPATPIAAPAATASPVAVAPESSANVALVDPAAPSPAVTRQDGNAVTRQDTNSVAAKEAAEARRLAARPIEDGSLPSSFVTSAPEKSSSASIVAPAIAAPPPVQSAEAPSLAAAPVDTSAPAASNTSTGGVSLTPVSEFFSNLFGGSPSPQPIAAAGAPATTASTGPIESTPPTATSEWQQAAVTPTTPGPAAAPKAAPAPAAKPVKQAAAATPTGKYKLHIAAVRSRAEAEAVAQKLAQTYGQVLSSRQPTVDEAVIGSMGTFYRVRVGGYANPEEPRGVCNKIRTSGFDCLVVTN